MANAPIWKSRPVFITSTFQDMQAERDHLRNQVFPALEEWLKSKRRHLEWIDLRVGVASANAEDEAARELLVLKVCLDEVKRSRPFLIALIGDRYGWVPPKERIKAAATEAGFSAEVEDRSVTDLEIDFGVFHDKDQQRRSLFFLRAPLPYDKMRTEKAAEHSDAYAPDQDAAKRWERLKALKTRIRTEYADRCFDYTAAWDEKAEKVTGLEAWGRDVEEKIKQALEAELAAEPEGAVEQTPDDVERDALADFAEDRARDFIGRKSTLSEIEALLGSPAAEGAPWGLCITGEAGSGKSALFSALYQGLTRIKKEEAERVSGEQRELYERLGKLDALVLAQAAGASPRATSVDAMLRRWIGELASFLNEAPGQEEKAGPNDVEAKFSSLLGRAALQRRVIVLVDALDQFEQTPQGRFVTWLPRLWPANARFIATAIPGEASEALSERPGIALKPIPALDVGEARHIATAISARYHREWEPQVLDALIGDDKRWGNPLWLVLAVEELNLLDADDFARARHDFEKLARDDERIRALMCEMATGFPSDVPSLYRKSFDHAAELFGAKLTQAFLGLIAVSRSGWRESDFREVLPKISSEAWDELRFAQLRRSFRGQLRRRGGVDQWDFAHAQMRVAAKGWLIESDGPSNVALHTALGDHLLALPADDPLLTTEATLHLLLGENSAEKTAVYCALISRDHVRSFYASSVIQELLISSRHSIEKPVIELVCNVVEAALPLGVRIRTFVFFTDRFLSTSDSILSLNVQIRIMDAIERAARKLLDQFPDDENLPVLLGKVCCILGELLLKTGRIEQAREKIQLSVEYRARGSQDVGDIIGIASAKNSLAVTLKMQGRAQEAEEALYSALDTIEELASEYPDSLDVKIARAEFHSRLGEMLLEKKEFESALDWLNSAFDQYGALQNANFNESRTEWRYDGDFILRKCTATNYFEIAAALNGIGDFDNALVAIDEAISFGDAILRIIPNDWYMRFRFAKCHCMRCEVLMAMHKDIDAYRASRTAIKTMLKLLFLDPDNREWLNELRHCWDNIGEILFRRRRFTYAIGAFRRAREIDDIVLDDRKRSVTNLIDRSSSYDKLGTAQLRAGTFDEADKTFKEYLGIGKELEQLEPGNPECLRVLALGYERTGNVRAMQGRCEEAISAYALEREVAQKLIGFDPKDVKWHRLWYSSHLFQALALDQIGRRTEALGHAGQALELARRKKANFPKHEQSDQDVEAAELLYTMCLNELRSELSVGGSETAAPTPNSAAQVTKGAIGCPTSEAKSCKGEGSYFRTLDDDGVELLREGKATEALEALRTTLFAKGGTVLRDGSAIRLVANYATAQLLTGDIRGAKSTLAQVWDKGNPAISRLLAAIDRWEQSLSFAERIRWRFGAAPPKPIRLFPPHGEL